MRCQLVDKLRYSSQSKWGRPKCIQYSRGGVCKEVSPGRRLMVLVTEKCTYGRVVWGKYIT
jgi:hypothetical protein